MPGEAEAPPINSTVLSIILIFIPGILCYGIVSVLADKKNRTNTTVFLQMFMYGVTSYLIAYLLNKMFPLIFPAINIPILNPSKIEHASIDPVAIAYASIISIFLALIITINVNLDILMKICQILKITKRSGDPDIWSFILNSDDIDNWVTIRNLQRSHIYQGYVRGFSTGEEKRQLLLTDVIVFDLESAEEVGKIPVLYMAFKDDDEIILELEAN